MMRRDMIKNTETSVLLVLEASIGEPTSQEVIGIIIFYFISISLFDWLPGTGFHNSVLD